MPRAAQAARGTRMLWATIAFPARPATALRPRPDASGSRPPPHEAAPGAGPKPQPSGLEPR